MRIDPDADNSLAIIKLEEAQYASICVSVLANPQLYMVSGIFDLSVFWSGQKSVIPVHYFLWMAKVGCANVTSDLVTNGTLSRTGFGGHVKAVVFSKTVRNLSLQ